MFHLVIVVEDDVVQLQGKVHHQTSDVQDWANVNMAHGASRNYGVGI